MAEPVHQGAIQSGTPAAVFALLLIGSGIIPPAGANDFVLIDDDSKGSVARDSLALEGDGTDAVDPAEQAQADDVLADSNDVALDPHIIPKLRDGRFELPPLGIESTDTEDIGNGRTPENFREADPVFVQPLPETASERVPTWNWTIAHWAAANTFSYPLYFEDRMLERHGHLRFGHLQPAAAATRFVTSAVMLPYLTTIDSPCECRYTLGYYRSGNCAPLLLQRPPYERRAAIAEAVWLGGAIAIFP